MNEMTLPSGHRIRDSSLSGPSASTLPLQAPHNIESSRVSVEDFKLECRNGGRNPRSLTFQADAALTSAPGHTQLCDIESEVQS